MQCIVITSNFLNTIKLVSENAKCYDLFLNRAVDCWCACVSTDSHIDTKGAQNYSTEWHSTTLVYFGVNTNLENSDLCPSMSDTCMS